MSVTGDVIPGGATLIFEVELLDIDEGPAPENFFKEIDADNDNKLSREEVCYYTTIVLNIRHPCGAGIWSSLLSLLSLEIRMNSI